MATETKANKSNFSLIVGVIVFVVAIMTFSVITNLRGMKQSTDITEEKYNYHIYESYKTIALNYIQVLNITDNESYNKARQSASQYLTNDLYEKLFPTDDYVGGHKEQYVSVESVSADFIENNEIVYNLNIIIDNKSIKSPSNIFVTVKNSKIIGVR